MQEYNRRKEKYDLRKQEKEKGKRRKTKQKVAKMEVLSIKFVKKKINWDKNSIHNLILSTICSIIDFVIKKGA